MNKPKINMVLTSSSLSRNVSGFRILAYTYEVEIMLILTLIVKETVDPSPLGLYLPTVPVYIGNAISIAKIITKKIEQGNMEILNLGFDTIDSREQITITGHLFVFPENFMWLRDTIINNVASMALSNKKSIMIYEYKEDKCIQ